MKPKSKTERINEKALELLKKHPEGLRWKDLHSMVVSSDPAFHPKTVNGLVWKLPGTFPEQVYKPERGIFRLTKYKT